MNIVLALQAISTLLTTISAATEAATKIQAAIATAQAEGRDLTDEEIQAITDETDSLEQTVKDKLATASTSL